MAGRSPLAEYEAHRIALIKPSSLGDILHSLPLLTALRQRYPQAHITWIINQGYECLVRGHPDLTDTLAFDRTAGRAGWWVGARTFARFLAGIRSRHFDLVIDLQGLFRSGLMAAASGAPRRVGLSTAREGATLFYTDVVRIADAAKVHAVDRYWRVAEVLGGGAGPRRFHVPLTEEAQRWAGDALAPLPRPWLMVGVGSRWRTKRWPPGHFAALIRRGQRRFGGSTILVGGPDEMQLAAAARAEMTGPTRDLTGRTTLAQLAALVARADVVVANDTGPLHLAVALGRPTVAPYTCTRVQRTGPYGSAETAVEAAVSCQGSYLKRCPRMVCMEELTPDRLWPPLYEVLLSWECQRARSA
jgi:heptosyltransferase-1